MNYDGEVEADACIMVGKSLEAGGVTAVKDVANPIRYQKRLKLQQIHSYSIGLYLSMQKGMK